MRSSSSSSLLSLESRSSSFFILQGNTEGAIQYIEEETKEKLKEFGFDSISYINFCNKEISLIIENIESLLQKKDSSKANSLILQLKEWSEAHFFNTINFPYLDEDISYFTACSYLINNEYQMAYDTLISIEAKQPTKLMGIKVRISRAFLLMKMNKYEQALTVIQPLLNKTDYDQLINELYALCLMKLGKQSQSKDVLMQNILMKKLPLKQTPKRDLLSTKQIQKDTSFDSFSQRSSSRNSSDSMSSSRSCTSENDAKKIKMRPEIKKDLALLMLEIIKKPI